MANTQKYRKVHTYVLIILVWNKTKHTFNIQMSKLQGIAYLLLLRLLQNNSYSSGNSSLFCYFFAPLNFFLLQVFWEWAALTDTSGDVRWWWCCRLVVIVAWACGGVGLWWLLSSPAHHRQEKTLLLSVFYAFYKFLMHVCISIKTLKCGNWKKKVNTSVSLPWRVEIIYCFLYFSTHLFFISSTILLRMCIGEKMREITFPALKFLIFSGKINTTITPRHKTS